MLGHRNPFPEDIGKSISDEESETVDELLQMLVDCLKKVDTRSREILLRNFFSEMEKDAAMVSFIETRLQQSKVKCIAEWLEKISSGRGSRQPQCDVSEGRGIRCTECDGVGLRGGEESTLGLGRFRIKTVNVGQIVEEEEFNQLFPLVSYFWGV